MSIEQFRDTGYGVLVWLRAKPLSGVGYAKYRGKKDAK